MNILVTGGAGYIGSHTCIELLNNGHLVIIADNLTNSKIESVNSICEITGKDVDFYQIDVTNELALSTVFTNHNIDGIIHFAGFKAVGESVKNPCEYYYNNLVSTIVLLKACKKYGVKKFVFSSSATVYGEQDIPCLETMKLMPTTNPYGETKAMSERIFADFSEVNPDYSIAVLRYFNPLGAHESGLIGEEHNGIPNNLMPYITQVAVGKREMLSVFGNDYNTHDGTGIRDYIHVVDLAKGHIKALNKLISSKGIETYNLGTGQGYSVLEIIKTFEKVTGQVIPYEITNRRQGDIAVSYADVSKAKRELGWKAEKSLEDMCRDAWRWELFKSKKANIDSYSLTHDQVAALKE